MFFEDPVFWKCAYIWKTSEEKVSKNTVRTRTRKTCKNHPKNEQKTHQKSSKNMSKKHIDKLTTQFQPRGRKRCPKIGRQGGKGGIQDGILLEKKKEYCKNQTYCGERVHAGKVNRRHFEAQHAPAVGRRAARGRIFRCFLVHFRHPFGQCWTLLAPFGPLLAPCWALLAPF